MTVHDFYSSLLLPGALYAFFACWRGWIFYITESYSVSLGTLFSALEAKHNGFASIWAITMSLAETVYRAIFLLVLVPGWVHLSEPITLGGAAALFSAWLLFAYLVLREARKYFLVWRFAGSDSAALEKIPAYPGGPRMALALAILATYVAGYLAVNVAL